MAERTLDDLKVRAFDIMDEQVKLSQQMKPFQEKFDMLEKAKMEIITQINAKKVEKKKEE